VLGKVSVLITFWLACASSLPAYDLCPSSTMKRPGRRDGENGKRICSLSQPWAHYGRSLYDRTLIFAISCVVRNIRANAAASLTQREKVIMCPLMLSTCLISCLRCCITCRAFLTISLGTCMLLQYHQARAWKMRMYPLCLTSPQRNTSASEESEK